MMSADDVLAALLLEQFRHDDGGDSIELRVERPVDFEPGMTFSQEAMDTMTQTLLAFIGGRIMARWDATGEPPTYLSINVDLTIG